MSEVALRPALVRARLATLKASQVLGKLGALAEGDLTECLSCFMVLVHFQ